MTDLRRLRRTRTARVPEEIAREDARDRIGFIRRISAIACSSVGKILDFHSV